jgi:hypothetical protein
MRHELLFNSGELRPALEAQARSLRAEVEAAPEEHILRVDEEEWIAALAER